MAKVGTPILRALASPPASGSFENTSTGFAGWPGPIDRTSASMFDPPPDIRMATRRGVAVMPGDWIVADADGAVLIPQAKLAAVLEEAPEQERMEAWIMEEVGRGVPLPGLYPMNAETKARYDAFKAKG